MENSTLKLTEIILKGKKFMKKHLLVLFIVLLLLSMLSSSANAINTGQLPLSLYQPNNSYFSNSGQSCSQHHMLPDYPTCHTDGTCGCKSFDNSIQCMGFAKYVFAEYSNMTNFSSYYTTQLSNAEGVEDVKRKMTYTFSSAVDAKTAFSELKKGDYVRMRKAGRANDLGGNGHSFIILSVTSTSVTVYEANFDQECGVSTRVLTYTSLINSYDKISFALQHKYPSTYSYYNTNYHVRSCSTSNCTGKNYQQHYATNPGPNAVCLACGYHGYISIGYNDLPDVPM